jgi:aldehyde dehydrogenase (NAD+)
MVVREPLGVTAHITPWNYPAQMFGRTIAPALAMGNAAVFKPAEDACLVCLELGKLIVEAGFPPGALNIVTGLGERAGAALTASPDINFVSFTGSPEVGRLVQEAAAHHHVPVVLELGGKSPQVVFEDADLERAAASVCTAITQNAGQTCSAGSRVLVQRSVFDRFSILLRERFAALRIGRPEDDAKSGSSSQTPCRTSSRSSLRRACQTRSAMASSSRPSSSAPRPPTMTWSARKCSAPCS